MGRVLDLTPPTFDGDVKEFCRQTERYLQELTEKTDYELLKIRKQLRGQGEGSAEA